MQTTIHPTAHVSKRLFGSECDYQAYCVIGDKVTLGDNVTLHSHVVIDGNTKLGEGVRFSPLRRLVLPLSTPVMKARFRADHRRNNVIREYVTFHPGTAVGNMHRDW